MGIDYISRSCDFPKKIFLMDYISIYRRYFPKITKKGNLTDDISRSCDLPKKENLMAYISGHVTYSR